MFLVIDDEAAIRMITQQTLESFGYRVRLADGGAAAIALYAQHKDEISVVLTDMMVPVMDGITIVQMLRQLNAHVEVIAASDLADADTVAKATQAGITHLLQKPYTTVAAACAGGDS
jgi:CheY-like chemotaxis protein